MGLRWKPSAMAGLGAWVLGLALFVSSPATQAEKGASWMVKGINVSKSLEPKIQTQEVEGSGLPLTASFVLFGVEIEYRCASFELLEFTFLAEGSGAGKVRYTGCQYFVEKGVVAPCAPEVEGKPGVIETTKLKALVVLHTLEGGSTDPLVRIEPSEGKSLANIATGEECSVSAGSFGGVVYVKDGNGKFAAEETTHLAAIGPLTKVFFDVEKVSVTLGGSALLALTGKHSGAWSGLPA
jgi:hypothetical protein